jgi:hypothetical protein
MKIIDHVEAGWYLIDNNGDLLIDVNCSGTYVDYSLLIRLNEDEVRAFRVSGRAYIDKLADDISYHGRDKYGSRKVEKDLEEKAYKEILDWRRKKGLPTYG